MGCKPGQLNKSKNNEKTNFVFYDVGAHVHMGVMWGWP